MYMHMYMYVTHTSMKMEPKGRTPPNITMAHGSINLWQQQTLQSISLLPGDVCDYDVWNHYLAMLDVNVINRISPFYRICSTYTYTVVLCAIKVLAIACTIYIFTAMHWWQAEEARPVTFAHSVWAVPGPAGPICTVHSLYTGPKCIVHIYTYICASCTTGTPFTWPSLPSLIDPGLIWDQLTFCSYDMLQTNMCTCTLFYKHSNCSNNEREQSDASFAMYWIQRKSLRRSKAARRRVLFMRRWFSAMHEIQANKLARTTHRSYLLLCSFQQ